MLESNGTNIADAAAEKPATPEPIPQDQVKVRLFSVCDIGVVKIHIPAGPRNIDADVSFIEDIAQHNALSRTSKKSNHDIEWPDEIHVDDPRSWPTWRKWMVTLIVSSISLCS
jgi:hypothetical protein